MAGHSLPRKPPQERVILQRESLEPELQELLEESLAAIAAIYRGAYDKSETLSAFYAIKDRADELLASLDG